MTRIALVKDRNQLLRGARALLVIARAAAFAPKRLERLLPDGPHALLAELASDAEPGDQGAVASTLTGASPRKLQAGVLPNEVSRYNSPARPLAISRVVDSAKLASGKRPGKDAVLLVLDEPAHLLSALNAVARALPEFSRKADGQPDRVVQILAVDAEGATLPIPEETRLAVEATRAAAALVDTPPTEMNPAAVVREARAWLRGAKHVKIREISGDELLQAGLGGIHAVGRTAVIAPRLFIASYEPPKSTGPALALVGKGVTFDTGGLSLKPGTAMTGMKADMGGAAAVLGAFQALVLHGVPRKLHLLLALAENAIGPDAYKPDDILTLHSKKTVEINNTDAEGRLVLADAVSWAARELKAEIVIDAATLTGAQLVATGLAHAALISNDADLERVLVEAGRASGDLVHPLPFAPELYKKEFKSTVADMKNSVKDRNNAQSSCAAQFIYNHIEDAGVRWAHVDLAGPAFREERATGFGVALLVEAVRRLA